MKSKLLKILAIPALAFSLSSNKADAQTRLQLQGDIAFKVGWNYTNEKIIPYENWDKSFLRPNEDLSLTEDYFFNKFDIDISLDPTINFNDNFKLGGTIEGSLGDLTKERDLGKVFVNGWKYDPVEMQKRYIKQITPSLGGFLEIPVRNHDYFLRLKATTQKYRVMEEKIKDKDCTNLKSFMCPPVIKPKTEVIFEKSRLKDKITKRFSLDIKGSDNGFLGIYYEGDFKRFHEFGARAGIYFSTNR
jgi:hypothetical protein